MSDRPRLTMLVCGLVEDTDEAIVNVIDYWKEAIADGEVSEREITGMTVRLVAARENATEAAVVAADADSGVHIGLTMQKCGPDSPQVQRLLAARQSRLRVILGGGGGNEPGPAGPAMAKRAA